MMLMTCVSCQSSVSPPRFNHRSRKCNVCHASAEAKALDILLLHRAWPIPERVAMALDILDRCRWAYRSLHHGGSAAALGLALRNKTKALILHDRILRCEVHP